jgi:hypothetical protein
LSTGPIFRRPRMGDTELVAFMPGPLWNTLQQGAPKRRVRPEQGSEGLKRVKRE